MIADADRAARVKAVDIADAAERRPTAWLALQAHDQGTVTLEDVVGRFERLTRLDPGMTVDWIELARLYDEQGRLADARQAAEFAYKSLAGSDERDRSVVLDELGDVAVQGGDLTEASARFAEGLVIARKLRTWSSRAVPARSMRARLTGNVSRSTREHSGWSRLRRRGQGETRQQAKG